MDASLVAGPIRQGRGAVRIDVDECAGRRYVRANERMSKRVYRAQVFRHVFGARAARVFMRLMRVDTGVAHRVLHAPASRLRR